MAAPVIYLLGGMAIRVATGPAGKKLIQKLIDAGARKQPSYKKFSKTFNATKDNISRLIDRAKGRIPIKEAQKRAAENAQKVSSKEFGKRKLSEFGEVGVKTKPKPESKVKPKPKSSKTTVLRTAAALSAIPKRAGFGEMTKAEQEEVKKANAENAKFKEKVGELKAKKVMTVKEINKLTKKALEDAWQSQQEEERMLLQMEKKYLPKDVNKLKSSLRPKARPETKKKTLSAFGSAFANARKAKKYSFKFRGKEYTTRFKEETVAEHKKKFLKKKKK